jgi:predicted nucleic acid-binding protein
VLIIDTGVLLAAADDADPAHRACADLVETSVEPLVTSPFVIAETGYLIDPAPWQRWFRLAEEDLAAAGVHRSTERQRRTVSDAGRMGKPRRAVATRKPRPRNASAASALALDVPAERWSIVTGTSAIA